MAKQFSEDYSTKKQQTEFVLFLDGSEKTVSASEADVEEFRQSWNRPKWHVLAGKPRVDGTKRNTLISGDSGLTSN